MFYRECESIANEFPKLGPVVAQLDDLIGRSSTSALLIPQVIASHYRFEISDVSSAMDLLTKHFILTKGTYIVCPNCDVFIDTNSIESQEYECTCGVTIDTESCKSMVAYRTTMAEKKHDEIRRKQPEVKTMQVADNELPESVRQDPLRRAHLLRYFSGDTSLQEAQPFKGKRGLFVLHFLEDMLAFVTAMERLGLDLSKTTFFYKEYPYPQRDAVGDWIESKGAKCLPIHDIGSCLDTLERAFTEDLPDETVFVVEDGGYLVPMIHRNYPEILTRMIGAVEQTTRGIRNDETVSSVKVPVLSVAGSNLKAIIEPKHVAEAVISNIRRLLPQISLAGKEVGILGFGLIGRAIADWMRKYGAIVTIWEPLNSENKLVAKQDGFTIADSIKQAMQGKAFVIGASGRTSVDSTALSFVSHGTNLISASSDQYEIDIDEICRQSVSSKTLLNDNHRDIGTTYALPSDDREVHLIANGYPVNFWGSESMPDDISDVILCVLFLAAVELQLSSLPAGIDQQMVDSIIERYHVIDTFLRLSG